MNKDSMLISQLKTAVKSASLDFCRAYNDNAGNESAETILSILESHLRIARKLSSAEKNHPQKNDSTEKAVLADIHEFLYKEKNNT